MLFSEISLYKLYELEKSIFGKYFSSSANLSNDISILFNPNKIIELNKSELLSKINMYENNIDCLDNYDEYINLIMKRDNVSLALKNSRNLSKKSQVDILELQDLAKNSNIFSHLDDKDIQKIIVIYERSAKKIIELKKILLDKEKLAKKSHELNKNILFLNSILDKLKYFRIYLVENILYRLELSAKNGFITEIIFNELAKYLDIGLVESKVDKSWDDNRLQTYFSFVLQSISLKHKKRLAEINWGVGKLVLRDDNQIVLYPNIFTKGEIPLSKPWFGFIFPGQLLIYNLFANPVYYLTNYFLSQNLIFLLKDINSIADINEDISSNIHVVLEALEKEFDYIESEKSNLWSIFNTNVISVCNRWQNFLQSRKHIIIANLAKLVIHTKYQDWDNKVFKTLLLLSANQEMLSYDTRLDLRNTIVGSCAELIVKMIVLHNVEGREALRKLRYIISNNVFVSFLSKEEVENLNDIISMFGSQKKSLSYASYIIDKTVLMFDITKDKALFTSDNTSNINNKDFLIQAVTNRLYFDKITSSKTELQTNSFLNRLIIELQNKNTSNISEMISSISYTNSLPYELFSNPSAYNTLSTLISNYISSNSDTSIELGKLVIDYGKEDDIYNYGLQYARSYLNKNRNIIDVFTCDYLSILSSDNPTIYSSLKIEIEELFLEKVELLFCENEFNWVDNFDNSNTIDISHKNRDSFDNIINKVTSFEWNKSIVKFIDLFGNHKDKEKYYRNNLLNILYGENTEPKFLDFLSNMFTDTLSWRALGCDYAASNSLRQMLVELFDRKEISKNQLDVLSIMMKNDEFCIYHNLNDIRELWKKHEELWVLRVTINNELDILKANSNILINCTDNLDILIESLTNSKYYNLLSNEYSKHFIDLIWDDISFILKEKIVDGDISYLDSYSYYLNRIVSVLDPASESYRKANFIVWLLSKRDYISTANIRVSQAILSNSEFSLYVNSLTVYLLYIGVLTDEAYSKMESFNSIEYLLTLCEEQSLSNIKDPFQLSEKLSCKVNLCITDPKNKPYLDLLERIDEFCEYFMTCIQKNIPSIDDQDIVNIHRENIKLIFPYLDGDLLSFANKVKHKLDSIIAITNPEISSLIFNSSITFFQPRSLSEDSSCKNKFLMNLQ
jgi:hypothetical protein